MRPRRDTRLLPSRHPDDAQIRHLTLALPSYHAARLFDAQDAGAGEQQLRALAGEALGEVYFRGGGRRATGLEIQFTDVKRIGFDLWQSR
ncbi:hypothetical protein ACWZEH_34085 (plasmid) [Streptomyces sp. QTS137]